MLIANVQLCFKMNKNFIERAIKMKLYSFLSKYFDIVEKKRFFNRHYDDCLLMANEIEQTKLSTRF